MKRQIGEITVGFGEIRFPINTHVSLVVACPGATPLMRLSWSVFMNCECAKRTEHTVGQWVFVSLFVQGRRFLARVNKSTGLVAEVIKVENDALIIKTSDDNGCLVVPNGQVIQLGLATGEDQ